MGYWLHPCSTTTPLYTFKLNPNLLDCDSCNLSLLLLIHASDSWSWLLIWHLGVSKFWSSCTDSAAYSWDHPTRAGDIHCWLTKKIRGQGNGRLGWSTTDMYTVAKISIIIFSDRYHDTWVQFFWWLLRCFILCTQDLTSRVQNYSNLHSTAPPPLSWVSTQVSTLVKR